MTAPSTEIAAAYGVCRGIAKREAKNFYYAFRVLPQAKSDAMCAVYAFMRKADDLADDESKAIAVRRVEMAAWLAEWRAAREAGGGDDPVFVALEDTQRRFDISDDLLEQLVRGTTMDLYAGAEDETSPGTVQVQLAGGRGFEAYATFAGLYRYCYLVASVVGLVSIKIFGYSDPAAEKLAEETGIAFQLTNILRDVQEDVERGRIYLPMDDMLAAGATFEEIVRASGGEGVSAGTQALLAREGARAEAYYGAAERLLPMIHPDGRAALWVMVTIYHELLLAIAAAKYDVFGRRVSVSTPRKLWILAQGYAMARRLRAAA